ncbi:tRNA-splicing endonuclease subunit Sen2, partial [Tremellales sp. Uapishka_1]
MSVSTAPAPSSGPRDFSGKNANRQRAIANNQKYGTPLPMTFPSSPSGILHSYLPTFLLPSNGIAVPKCVGIFDASTSSVWVLDEGDKETLFRKGFFGKGTLSRSEPSWRERKIGLLKGGDKLLAEQMREQRRLARKQFKIDRAQAFLDAAKQAEAVLTSGQTPTGAASSGGETPLLPEGTKLNAQTFLVRPERPDANRNRGKRAFKPRPKPKADSPVPAATPAVSTAASASAGTVAEALGEGEDEDEEEEEFDESLVLEMENLQLGLEEAWFLSSAIGVLKVYDPKSETYLPPNGLLPLFLTPAPAPAPSPLAAKRLYPDDPFLVSYVVYHHFRSLGWVVKPGIKFASDWLLYKRGPVFSHSMFSVVVIPVYEDHNDRETSPFGHEDWYEERLNWKWMNTIMRVNSLVQKTVILVYVTIPSKASFPESSVLQDRSIDINKNDMASLLKRYSVREVSLTRFGPARRRD